MTENTKIELVTICYWSERYLLKIQARSIAVFLDPGLVASIFVIVNDNRLARFCRFFQKEILPLYGKLSEKVRLIHYPVLYNCKVANKELGWKSQQVLKLLSAKLVDTDEYMLLDSKNHFIRKVEYQNLYAPDGKIYTPMYQVNTKFHNMLLNACDYFGYRGIHDFDKAMPSATPYVMKTSLVSTLIEEIQMLEKMPFHRFFMGSRRFTEFYLYYAYLLARYGGSASFYTEVWNPCVTLFAGFYGNRKIVDEQIDSLLQRQDVYCFGIHRRFWQKPPPGFLRQVKDIWMKFGLITADDDFDSFIKSQFNVHYFKRAISKLYNRNSLHRYYELISKN